MLQLIDLLNKTEDRDIDKTIFQIELNRQVGNFEKALKVINNADAQDKHYHQNFIRKSEKLIARKNKQLFKI